MKEDKKNKEDKDDRLITDLWFIVFLSLVLLIIGIVGFYFYEGRGWVDAFYDTSAILSVAGATSGPQSVNGKIFGGIYTLIVGLGYIFLIGFAIITLLDEN